MSRILTVLLLCIITVTALTVKRPILDSKPNILIFFVDDLQFTSNWNHSSPSGVDLDGTTIQYYNINTPNIQSIIEEGVVFSRSYAGGPKCSPSRFSLLTGRYPVRSETAIELTSNSRRYPPYAGTRVEVPFSKIYGNNDNVNNLPTLLQQNGYFTGQTGKWHLMSSDDNGNNVSCSDLDSKQNNELYVTCTTIIKQQGFDMVDAYYDGNIITNENFSHNPEYMVDIAQKFIHHSNTEHKPFFLYFSPTLKHTSVSIIDAVTTFTNRDTPKGELNGDDIPSNTGMKTRTQIYEEALTYDYTDDDMLQRIIGTIWVDDALGALINYLKDNNLYDNTFIALYNDHGMGCKATLYEQGARIFQYIRFPPYWNHEIMQLPYYLPNHFITSNVDLAAVIYDMIGINNNNEIYQIDGKSWIDDVFKLINDNNAITTCCDSRHIDMYNSHAIVDENWKYIYRATNETAGGVRFYVHGTDEEQLYNIVTDPSEQYNLINETSVVDIVSNFRQSMDDYIQNIACFSDECKSPLSKTCIKYQTKCASEVNCFGGDEYLGTSERCGLGGNRKYDCQFCPAVQNKRKKRQKKREKQKDKTEI